MIINQSIQHNRRRGQAMILTVVVLSSTVLALSAIGGYMMLVRLRVSSDIMNTTRAIYIADAGLECAAFSHFKKGDGLDCASGTDNLFYYNEAVPVEEASYSTEYVAGPPSYIRAIGGFRNSNRAFRIDF